MPPLGPTEHLLNKTTFTLQNQKMQLTEYMETEANKKRIMYVPNKPEKKGKTVEKELKEMEVSHLIDKEFKVMIIKVLIKLCKQVGKLSENFNKEKVIKRTYQS